MTIHLESILQRVDSWNLKDWLKHIQSLHSRSIDLELDRVRRVLHRLHWQAPSLVVVVAGTNGKGSTIAMLEAIYRSAGYRVGAFTSPHLVSYCERVRLDRVAATETEICQAFVQTEAARSGVPLTYFEFGTLAALWLLHRHRVDIALLEVGLGGRLDAVNAVNPDLAVITAIAIDHQAWLGNTREAIGAEKAGIFRYRGRVVIGDSEPPRSISERSIRLCCDTRVSEVDYHLRPSGQGQWHWEADSNHWPDGGVGLVLPGLPGGSIQRANAACALAAVRLLQDRVPVADYCCWQGLQDVHLPGRQQVVAGSVERIFDVAHNTSAVIELADTLRRKPVVGRTIAVFSILADKELATILATMADLISLWFITRVDNDRATSLTTLAAALSRNGNCSWQSCPEPVSAYQRALRTAQPGDRIVVFGSFYLVGAILALLREETAAA
ncbi:MAG: bifunctional tetrahydrofolate synthase/dihydrofolate synthase [Arenicellales bacterium]|nr:bifunctional tetrahydrofolate synthase/dihydrofolate synthase [Arenicellales bacterium]